MLVFAVLALASSLFAAWLMEGKKPEVTSSNLMEGIMAQDDDPVFTHPESYGIENLEAPGEPNRAALPEVSPVPGTGHEAREEHRRRHDAQGATPSDADFRDRKEREEREEARREVEEAE